jgi:hypothetical protein
MYSFSHERKSERIEKYFETPKAVPMRTEKKNRFLTLDPTVLLLHVLVKVKLFGTLEFAHRAMKGWFHLHQVPQ